MFYDLLVAFEVTFQLPLRSSWSIVNQIEYNGCYGLCKWNAYKKRSTFKKSDMYPTK